MNIKNIAVIDDDIMTRTQLNAVLINAGYSCHVFESGADFLNFLEQGGQVDLILADIFMPEMDGFDLIAMLNSHNIKTPVFTMTSEGPTYLEMTRLLGAVNNLPKPVIPDELFNKINNL